MLQQHLVLIYLSINYISSGYIKMSNMILQPN